MTSKSLFFKLMKEDFKTRVWTLAISILIFFFSLIVATAMMISFNLYEGSAYSYKADLALNFISYIDVKNPFFWNNIYSIGSGYGNVRIFISLFQKEGRYVSQFAGEKRGALFY